MFRAKTLFVIGAGASVEVGLPMGSDLLEHIVKLTNIRFEFNRQKTGDFAITEALKLILNEGREVAQLNAHLGAARQLGQSAQQALSIDNVIDALEDDKVEMVGKLGIVRAIHNAEKSSGYFKKRGDYADEISIPKFADTWYSSFTKILTENVRKSGVSDIFNNLSVINFNYDRCLEHYIPFAISNYYGLHINECRELMSSLPIHRPYGIAGRLPWQDGDGPSIAFGGGNVEALAEVAQQVRTFTERVEEGEQLQSMRDAVSSAERIIFLGFGFHRQNVELICQKVLNHAEVLATAYGISPSDQSVIEAELETAMEFEGHLNQGRITLADMTCSQFFDHHWRTITSDAADWEPVELGQRTETSGLEAMIGSLPRGFGKG